MLNILDEQTRVSFTKKIEIVDLIGEKILYDFDTGNYHFLMGSASDTMEYIKDNISVAEILDAVAEDFDVPREICLRDTSAFLFRLEEKGFLKLELS